MLPFNPKKTDPFDRLVNSDRTAAFVGEYGVENSVPLIGGYSGQLNNAGEAVRLEAPVASAEASSAEAFHVMVDFIEYAADGAWPAMANGAGQSLEREFVNLPGGQATSWVGASPSPGEFHGEASSFEILSVEPSDGYLDIRLLRDLDTSGLNLYDGLDPAVSLPDVHLVGQSSGPVRGTLVVSSDERRLRFVPTGGPLAPDEYTLRLLSHGEAFVDASGSLLDGDGDLVAGGDFEFVWTVGRALAGEPAPPRASSPRWASQPQRGSPGS